MEININENPDELAINEIRHQLQIHNSPFWEVKTKDKYVFSLKDDGVLLGGLVCTIFGEWLEIDFFWVNPDERKKGYGKSLLTKAEHFAVLKGCKKGVLSTLNFQAKPFYENSGFKIVYKQERYPITSTRYFMEKNLDI